MSRVVTPSFFKVGNNIFNPLFISRFQISPEQASIYMPMNNDSIYFEKRLNYPITKNPKEYKEVCDAAEMMMNMNKNSF